MMQTAFLSRTISFLVLSTFCACTNVSKIKEPQPNMPDTWYRNAVIYNLEVSTFKDSDNDGMGDFNGLRNKLGYLADTLGIDVIWLAPFQPSPQRDDGYDIVDHFAIDPRLGSMAEFAGFIAEAKRRGLRVIMDAVLNHTSIEHPWYQAARSDSTSMYHTWYVWSDTKPKDWDKGMVFPGVQNATWTYDEVAAKYYFHRFYDFQPDLNYENPAVQRKALEILNHWLAAGLDGFRLDAVPFIIDIPRTGSENPEHLFSVLTAIRKTVEETNPQTLLLGEANVSATENIDYFGEDGERLNMMFNFFANQKLFFSLAEQDPEPLSKALEEFKEKPALCQWAFFLRNHDEIDLARLTKRQRQRVYDRFGPETNMQLYERGIRRRLAPMIDNPRLIRMAYSLLFSLPGTPVLRYGEEIGMGDDLTLQERLAVRTPMQWDSSRHGGFTQADEPFRNVINSGEYAYEHINVERQYTDSTSLLYFIRTLVKARKSHPEIGRGNWDIIPTSSNSIFAIRYYDEDKQLITVHNFSETSEQFTFDKSITDGFHIDTVLHNEQPNPNLEDNELEGYGFKWLQLVSNRE
ncbi:alpha-amylase family protein [Sphingobacterium haloxyli]|uniref:Trehalose synthase n=1 Tax=Sphingobacterium haloxyli TaxID=2100533 RepID=A0A2S9J4R2_9SPHI|nr:alpha-amylase family protein [Sphingobacterium haloxyli]PRD47786.1 trehalose synthase [Sphingobacterium haloxyli]